IRGCAPLERADRAPLDHVPVLEIAVDRCRGTRLARQLQRKSHLLQQPQLEAAQDRLNLPARLGRRLRDNRGQTTCSARRDKWSVPGSGARERTQLRDGLVVCSEEAFVRIVSVRQLEEQLVNVERGEQALAAERGAWRSRLRRLQRAQLAAPEPRQ